MIQKVKINYSQFCDEIKQIKFKWTIEYVNAMFNDYLKIAFYWYFGGGNS